MAKTTINPLQIKITGSLAATIAEDGTFDGAHHFLTQKSGSLVKTVSADVMQAYFSKIDLTEAASQNEGMRLIFAAASGGDLDDEDLFVDSGVLTYNPSTTTFVVPHIEVGDDLAMKSDAAVLSFGENADVSLTHVHDTGLLLNSDMQLQFRDSTEYINSDADGSMNIRAATDIALNINGTDELLINASTATFGTNIVIPDAGTIGSASDTDAIAISDAGVITLSATTEASAIGTAALVVAGGASVAKDLYVGDDLELDSDGAKLGFGADSDVSLTHVQDTGLLLNGSRALQFGDAQTAINQSSDGVLSINADGTLDLNGGALDGDFTSINLSGGAVIVSGSGELKLTTSDTSNGVKIATGTSGVPVTIGHSTSEVTVADNLTVSGDTIVTGNLTVNGTTTTVNTTNMVVSDKLIELGNGTSGSPSGDAGLVIERGSSDNAVLVWDESEDEFFLGTGSVTGASTGDLSLTAADLQAGVIRSSKLEIDAAGNNIDVDTDLKIVSAADILLDPTGGDVKVDGNLLPNADDTSDLGSATAAWQDLHLEGDVLMTDAGKVETAAGALTLSAAGSSQKVIIDAAGDIDLDADSGQIVMKDDGTALFTFAANEIDVASGDLKLDVAADIILDAAGAHVKPGSNDQAALGDSSTRWSDLFMADGSVLNMGTSASAATLTHAQEDIFGSDIKDDRLTSSFSGFQVSRIVGSTLSSSTSTITMSPDVGTSIDPGTTIVFTAGSDTIAYDVSDSVASSATSFSVSYNAGASSATSVSVSGISNASKDLGSVKAAIQESSITSSTSALSFTSAAIAAAFENKIGAAGTLRISVSGGSATFTLASYTSGTSISLSGSPTMDTVSSASPSSATAFQVKSSSKSNKLTLDGDSASLNIQDHDGSSYGLELAGTLVTSTATELNQVDGDTSATSITVASGDRVVYNDNGTMMQVAVDNLGVYFGSGDGLQATSAGVLSVEPIIKTFHGSGSLTAGVSASFGSDVPINAAGIQVYLNGMLQTPSASSGLGSAIFDYHVSGLGGGSPAIVFESGVVDNDDAVVIHYLKK